MGAILIAVSSSPLQLRLLPMTGRCRAYYGPFHKRVTFRRSSKERIGPYLDGNPRPSSPTVAVFDGWVRDLRFRVLTSVRCVMLARRRLMQRLGSRAETVGKHLGSHPRALESTQVVVNNVVSEEHEGGVMVANSRTLGNRAPVPHLPLPSNHRVQNERRGVSRGGAENLSGDSPEVMQVEAVS